MTHMLLAFSTPQQVKCPEALDPVEMRLMRHPQILEGVAFSFHVHPTRHAFVGSTVVGNEHLATSRKRVAV
jgi:hypothetical protein